MNFNQCMEFISSYSRLGGKITDLSRAQELMERIGNPEKRLKFVHIAGTNGKGSTLEYIANALVFAGYKTGKFTSPFVTHYTDRIRINDYEIDEKALSEICEFVAQRTADRPYSQFEITMAVALLWYERENCDIVVLEAGIGGLLDSTNVIPPPLLSVITSISFDHTDILGSTIGEIASQKAGIIKKGSAVVLSSVQQSPDIYRIIRDKANEVGAEYIEPITDYTTIEDDGLHAPFEYRGQLYRPAMLGIHQQDNSVTAIEACCYLRKKGFDISDKNIKKSIETTIVQARVQYIPGNPPVIVDGGHNYDGVSALSDGVLWGLKKNGKKIYAVTGMVDSKDYEVCINQLCRDVDKMFTVDDFAPNCVSSRKLAEIAGECTCAEPCESLGEAVKKAEALALSNNGIVVVCGSLYLASEYLNHN